jgi:quercetin dioxygenase-like cupin family protein
MESTRTYGAAAMKVTYSGMLAVNTQTDMNRKATVLEQEIRRQGCEVELAVKHTFGGDVYARQLFIPKGHVVVGEIHKTENLNILLSGEIAVTTEEGVQHLKAPAILVAKPGSKRVGVAIEDAVWVTFHATRERDLDKIKAHFIAPSFEALPGHTSAYLGE